jgi:hypothetical protein
MPPLLARGSGGRGRAGDVGSAAIGRRRRSVHTSPVSVFGPAERSAERGVSQITWGPRPDPTSVTIDMRSAATPMRRQSSSVIKRRRSRDRSETFVPSASEGRTAVVPVLYVGGYQRSGSTLLDRMLGQSGGHVSTGEIVHLWARGLRANELCGCGDRFRECPFWTEVGRVGFGGWGTLDVEELLRLQHRVDRNRYIIFMLWPSLSARYRRDLSRYVAVLDRLYRAIREVGGGVIVDSSKHASTAFILRRVPSVRLRVVHLVRDSRGVAYSLLKKVRRPEAVDEETFMFRASAWRAGMEWLAFNGLFHILGFVGTSTVLARYERLVRSPRETIAEILVHEQAGTATDERLSFIDGSTVALGIDHSVAGNPMRLEHGSIELRVDTAWRASMSSRDRWITTFVTWPLLARYGYFRNEAR